MADKTPQAAEAPPAPVKANTNTPPASETPPMPEKPGHTSTNSTGRNHHEFQHHHITEYVHLPTHHRHLPHGIHEDGESGRKGLTPHFFRIIARSSCVPSAMVNILWPFVPAGFALFYASSNHRAIFATNYIAMIPSANLLGFAGQELARKLPKVFGVMLETFLGGMVEVVLFTALIVLSGEPGERDNIPVIQAAILGSILANLLFCMGLCFVAGGMRHVTQKFDGAITEVGCGLLLMAAFGLAIPRSFAFSLQLNPEISDATREDLITKISRADAIILLIAFCIYLGFQMFSHHGLYSSIFEADEQNDRDRDDDLAKDKLTLTECLVAIAIALTLVSFHAVFLVKEIDSILGDNITEMFLGLILVPLVEKFAEHLTAIDEAWDNTMNLALAHVLGATLQTALLNTSLVVLIGWGLGKPMNLDFEPFQVIIVVLAILAAGSFLRDQESNYLEGSLCVLIYALIAATAFLYPNEHVESKYEGGAEGGIETEGEAGAEASATETAIAAATSEVMGHVIENVARFMART